MSFNGILTLFCEGVMKTVDSLAHILLILGGLNLGLISVAEFDLVGTLLGAGSLLTKAVYTLVGVSAVYKAWDWVNSCSTSCTSH